MKNRQLTLDSELNLSSRPEEIDLSNMNKYEKLGFIGERYFYAVLISVAEEFGLRVEWTGKKSYDKKLRNEFRRGVDFKLYDKKGQLFWANENKNLKNPKKQYSTEDAQSQVINRFDDVPHAKHKSLSLPNFNVYNQKARNSILSKRIEVFELDKLIGGKDFRSKHFYIVKDKLRKFITALFNKDKEYEKRKQEERKKITEWLYSQQKSEIEKKFNSLANFILSLSNYVISYDYNTNISYETNKKTVDRPRQNNNITIVNQEQIHTIGKAYKPRTETKNPVNQYERVSISN